LGLDDRLLAVGGFFQNWLIEITQNAQTNVQGLVKFGIIGSFEVSLQVGVCADTHPGSDSHDSAADPYPKTGHYEKDSKFSGHFFYLSSVMDS
jgi:hypothetical protein